MSKDPWDLDRLGEAVDVLNEDLGPVREKLRTDDTPLARRQYVRALAASIEALTRLLSIGIAEVLHVEEIRVKGLTPDRALRYAVASGQRAQLADTGVFKMRARKDAAMVLHAFLIREIDRAMEVDDNPLLSDSRRPSLKRAFEIRNRVMHPTSRQDLEVSNEDLEILEGAVGWYGDAVRSLTTRRGDTE